MAGSLVIGTISDGTNSTSSTNAIMGSAKAWVNFTISATPSVVASYNVSSVTYVSGTQLTVNFTNAFADTNYLTVGATSYPNINSGNNGSLMREDSVRRTKTTSACPVGYYDTFAGQSFPATANAYLAFFR